MTHKCAADGCRKEISLALLMCHKHLIEIIEWILVAAVGFLIIYPQYEEMAARYRERKGGQ
jgi:hypothetical protein